MKGVNFGSALVVRLAWVSFWLVCVGNLPGCSTTAASP